MGKEKELRITTVPLVKIETSGIVDLNGLYENVWEWFRENKYNTLEANHTEKVAASGKEIKIVWSGYKDPDDYVRFWIEVEMWILRANDVMVEENGKKVRRQRGDLEVTFTSYFNKDYRHRFKSSAAGRFLRELYEKYLIKSKLEKREDDLIKETFRLQERAKLATRQFVREG